MDFAAVTDGQLRTTKNTKCLKNYKIQNTDAGLYLSVDNFFRKKKEKKPNLS